MRNLIIMLIVIFGVGINAHGQSKSKSMGSQSYAYGMAGCGLGSLVIKDNTQISQLVVWLIDTYFIGGCAGQTSSISTGTSNCTDKAASISKIDREVYIAANFAEIQKEAAQGRGEHLTAFAQILGCGEQERQAFAEFSQQNYGKIFGSNEPNTVLENLQRELKTNELFSENCTEIG